MNPLLSLPDDVLEQILSYISYDEVSHCRLVCQRFNEISKRVLNHGFHKVEKYHTQCLKHVKSQLPRRESERRNHPLARHCDILTAVETRLSLLGMTFKKFIDLNFCCFIPGKVLDEIYKVLRYVTTEQSPVRAHEVLQELRDLSSMAMEYFDEKIAPALKKHKDTGPKLNILCNTLGPIVSLPSFDDVSRVVEKLIRKHNTKDGETSQGSVKHLRPNSSHSKESRIMKMAHFLNELAKRQNKLRTEMTALQVKKKEFDSIGKRLADVEQFVVDTKKKIVETEKTVAEQQITITNQAVQIKEQELKIEKLSKLIEGKPGVACRSSKSIQTNKRKKQSLTPCKVKSTPISLRSSKRKLVNDLTGENAENGCKKIRK